MLHKGESVKVKVDWSQCASAQEMCLAKEDMFKSTPVNEIKLYCNGQT